MSAPKIILYTNRLCPWAHRAHIALKESGLDFEEVTIDLDTPREPWYLEINPVSDSLCCAQDPMAPLCYTRKLTQSFFPTARPSPHSILQRYYY